MQKNHVYVFSDEDKAKRFYNSVWAGGYEAEIIGNAVLSDDRVWGWVVGYCEIAADEYPIWMSENY